MRERKNIDRLYQEKFKDFEAAPAEAVWNSISDKLQEKKKKRRILPLWYRVAGVAALFALLLTIGDWFSPKSSPAIVNEKDLQDEFSKEIIPENNVPLIAASEEKNSQPQEEAQVKNRKGNPTRTPKEETIATISASDKKEQKITSEGSIFVVKGDFKAPEKSNEKSLTEIAFLPEDPEKAESSVAGNILEISTFAAPVFFGSLGEGSFLDPQFNDNSRQSEVTYSYGVQLAYAITEKLKIRSGLNMVSMSFNTNGIEYHAVVRPAAIASVNYDREPYFNLTTSNKSSAGSEVKGSLRASEESLYDASLNQKLGYLEIPLEIEYNLIDKTVEVNLIGGGSTLFLNENIVSVNSGKTTTELGKANNLNQISFSTNIGLGVDYNLTDKVKLNLEPMFKYQINTFESSSVNYQPFYLAIYSGFTFQF